MSVDHDELSLLKDTLRSREEELRACKKDALVKEDDAKSLKQELVEVRTSLEEKIERLSTFASLASSINSTLDLNHLLTYLMTCATKVMKAKDSSLMLLDERTNELVFKVALGEKSDQMQEFRLRMGQGIAGQVALSGQPIVVSDTKNDNRFDKSIDMATGFETKSIMCVPIKLREKVIGVIEVLNAGYSGPLTEEDLETFSAFANTAAVALQNARLFAAIQNSLEHICGMLESGALMTDDTGELIMINSIARELLGLGETGTVTMQDISQLKSDKDIASMIRVTYAESKSQAEEVTVGGEGGRKIKVNVALVTDPNGMKIGTVAVFREL
jgi:transcriptional regulator with GAF, ATPase, and Fis domain